VGRCEKELYHKQSDYAVCGCYESELCVQVIRGVFIPPILLQKVLNGSKRNGMGRDIPEFVQQQLSY
jgi:hypothetical protein